MSIPHELFITSKSRTIDFNVVIRNDSLSHDNTTVYIFVFVYPSKLRFELKCTQYSVVSAGWMGNSWNSFASISMIYTSRFTNGSGRMVGSNADTITLEKTMKNAKNDRKKFIILADVSNFLDCRLQSRIKLIDKFKTPENTCQNIQ